MRGRGTVPSRPLVVAGSAVLASLALYGSFWLGAWAFDARRFTIHNTRLRRLVEQQPSLDRVTRGLQDEGSRLVASPATEEERRRVVAEFGKDRGPAILEKERRYPKTRVHVAGDVVYFLFYDDKDVLRDYAFVSR
jgi:hypothetical protein